jgi:hypothetical protein
MGRALHAAQFSGQTYRLEAGGLSPGVYFFAIETREGLRYSGKIMVSQRG